MRRRVPTDTNPQESLDAEGLAGTEEMAPGIDIELAEEAEMAPRDHAIAAGDDPAYAVTQAEQRRPEGVAQRASRELPEVGASDAGARHGEAAPYRRARVLGMDSSGAGRAAARQAVDADEPSPPEGEPVDPLSVQCSGQLGETYVDDMPSYESGEGEVWSTAGDEAVASSAEEAAVHIEEGG